MKEKKKLSARIDGVVEREDAKTVSTFKNIVEKKVWGVRKHVIHP